MLREGPVPSVREGEKGLVIDFLHEGSIIQGSGPDVSSPEKSFHGCAELAIISQTAGFGHFMGLLLDHPWCDCDGVVGRYYCCIVVVVF